MPLEIIAELHPQHGGDMGVIREMIRQAKLNGAHVAKIQLYDAAALLGSDQWSYLQFTEQDTQRIKKWCDQEEIEFMASVFDRERLRWCESIGVARYKIASRSVIGDPGLCRAILDLGKPTLISLGAWPHPEKPFGVSEQIAYLYCKANYPTFLEDLADFPKDFPKEGFAGYSDHTIGIEVCLLAIARGATLLEKHFTLEKTRGKPTEKGHIGSMLPHELNTLARVGGALSRAQNAIRELSHAKDK